MVAEQIQARGVRSPEVVAALRTVPRHEFVPLALRDESYEDHAVSLAPGRSLSQPYIVGAMTELAAVQPGQAVLEIGTGTGYQAAVLAELCARVWTIDSDPDYAAAARATLTRLFYRSVEVRRGDGREGIADGAPFDAILITAAVREIPPALIEQLAPGGRLVAPIGPPSDTQVLQLVTKTDDGRIVHRDVFPVRFVALE